MKKYIIVAALSLLMLTSNVFAEKYVFSFDLKLGSSGTDVSNLQTWLIDSGYDIPAISKGISNKGYFGSQTKLALIAYQKSVGLPAYGFFGPMTREKINGDANVSAFNLTSPNGGEIWQKGTTQMIKWNAPAFFRATYVDISLVPYYQPCTGQVCPMLGQTAEQSAMLYRMPYSISRNISIDNHYYAWVVGNYEQSTTPSIPTIVQTVPDGQYAIQICQTGTSVCTSSKKPFTINSAKSLNLPPLINSIDAPTTLNINQTGTWTVKASDPENGVLSYSVDWGDSGIICSGDCKNYLTNTSATRSSFVQTSTFTHTYTSTGTFSVRFTVRDNAGNETKSAINVQINNLEEKSATVLSPNGGEIWNINSEHLISWKLANNLTVDTKVDLYLSRYILPTCPAAVGSKCPVEFENSTYILDKNFSSNLSYNWIAGTDVSNKIIPKGRYGVKVCIAGTSNCDYSDQPFTLQ